MVTVNLNKMLVGNIVFISQELFEFTTKFKNFNLLSDPYEKHNS
jgi:hypothetical protein